MKRNLEDLKQGHDMIRFMLENNPGCCVEVELSWQEEQK